MMRLEKGQQGEVLTRVREEFARFRKECPGRPWIPAKLRTLALAAATAGHPIRVVEEVAGVGRGSIGRWRLRKVAAPPTIRRAMAKAPVAKASSKRTVALTPGEASVRELRIIREEAAPPSTAITGVAVVRLGRGVAIEVPVASITEAFLKSLAAASPGGAL